jgi:hypothetical protein
MMSVALSASEMNKLKIPYSKQEVGHCYERLKQTMPVYQEGIADIRSEMESESPFETRLQNVLRRHEAVMKTADPESSPHSWNEDDVYFCVLYDMLEAMLAAESEHVAKQESTPDQKRKAFDALGRSIARLPFGSPQYRSSIRPRLEKIVADNRKKL